ncbi:MAG: hypothetical protein ACI85J_001000 [Candidatus Poriferisodalaceae bacterium]|jgi:hypothetical protein|tara:strand:- start:11107 stop:11580 length:474 start_codon:yes stop_codon:yes gene_type:complete
MSDDTKEPNEEPDIDLDGDLDDLEIDLEIDDDDAVPPEGDEADDASEIEVPSGVKITSEEEEEEDDDDDDEVEADLDTILRERLASEDEDEDESETETGTEEGVTEKVLVSAEGDRILSKQEDEVLCTGCFLLVKASQYDDRGGTAACPHCGTPIGS